MESFFQTLFTFRYGLRQAPEYYIVAVIQVLQLSPITHHAVAYRLIFADLRLQQTQPVILDRPTRRLQALVLQPFNAPVGEILVPPMVVIGHILTNDCSVNLRAGELAMPNCGWSGSQAYGLDTCGEREPGDPGPITDLRLWSKGKHLRCSRSG